MTSLSDFKFYLGGGNSNHLRMIQVVGPAAFQEFDLDLSLVRPSPAEATGYGIISGGSVWQVDIADTIALPSTDGTIYALWYVSCIDTLKAWGAKSSSGSGGGGSGGVHPLTAERDAMRAAAARRPPPAAGGPAVYGTPDPADVRAALGGGDPFPPCVQWAVSLGAGGNKPSYSPTRYVPGTPAAPAPLVLASESDPDLDTAGVLWALHAANGSALWSHAAVDSAGTSWGLTGVVPAVDDARDNMVFLAYGARVVALSGATGAVVGDLDASAFPEPEDPGVFLYAQGYLDSGDDAFGPLLNQTLDSATAACVAVPSCVGFTFQNGAGSDWRDPFTIDPLVYVFFKNKVAFTPTSPRARWATFRKPGAGIDPFVSSPVLSSDRNALFLHSTAGTLWRVDIAPLTVGTVKLTVAWCVAGSASVLVVVVGGGGGWGPQHCGTPRHATHGTPCVWWLTWHPACVASTLRAGAATTR